MTHEECKDKQEMIKGMLKTIINDHLKVLSIDEISDLTLINNILVNYEYINTKDNIEVLQEMRGYFKAMALKDSDYQKYYNCIEDILNKISSVNWHKHAFIEEKAD